MKKLFTFIIIIALFTFNLTGCDHDESYQTRLYTPTYVTKIDNNYFIVDCWHHRIIYNKNLHDPIAQWKVLTNDIAGPHTIVSDGKILIAEDTGRHRLFVFQKIPVITDDEMMEFEPNNTNKEYELTQILSDIGKRPHRIIYDEKTKLFYVIAAISQQISAIKDNNGVAEILYTKKLPFLKQAYTRSINIINDEMVFVSGPGKITFTTYQDGKYQVIKQYDVPPAFSEMNDMVKINDYYYITASPRMFVRVKNLENFGKGDYEDLNHQVGYKGTPYFFNKIDDRFFLPEITEYSSIISFKISNNKIQDVINHYDFGLPTQASIDRKKELKK